MFFNHEWEYMRKKFDVRIVEYPEVYAISTYPREVATSKARFYSESGFERSFVVSPNKQDNGKFIWND
jgi:hypothetical protein